MSTRRAVVIVCDHPGCDEEYVGRARHLSVHQRQDARGDHWTYIETTSRHGVITRTDLCPDHKDASGGAQ